MSDYIDIIFCAATHSKLIKKSSKFLLVKQLIKKNFVSFFRILNHFVIRYDFHVCVIAF